MLEFRPSVNEIKNLVVNSPKDFIIPIWCEIVWDLETPVSAYYKVCKDKPFSFLLESVEGGENFGRYSFIGYNPLAVLKSEFGKAQITDFFGNLIINSSENPYDLMEEYLKKYETADFNLPFSPGLVGYFGFDTIRHIEPKLNESFKKVEDCSSFPEAFFVNAGTVLAFDHVRHKIFILNNIIVNNSTDIEMMYENSKSKIKEVLDQLNTSNNLTYLELSNGEISDEVESNISKEDWINSINTAKEHILAGDIFQVVLSQRFCVSKRNISSLNIYRALRSINPSPYLYLLNFGDFQIIGSSPEMMVKCDKDGIAKVTPIAGTRKRGLTADQDNELESELLADPKERAEHVMLVDLGRNDLGRVCEYGSVKVDKFMTVEKFSHVMHIVSHVTGKLKEGISSVELLKACFPAGTLSGAPKVRAIDIIYNLEKAARGPYGGCIGFIGFNKEINTAITIRTMLVKDDNIFIQAGAGIVADSDPETEFVETQNKAAALIQALARIKN